MGTGSWIRGRTEVYDCRTLAGWNESPGAATGDSAVAAPGSVCKMGSVTVLGRNQKVGSKHEVYTHAWGIGQLF